MSSPSKLNLPLIDISAPAPNPANDFEFMATNGYLVKKGLFEEALIDEVREWTQWRFSHEDMQEEGRIQDAFRQAPCVARLAAHRTVLAMLKDLYGRSAIPFQTLNFHRGTQQRTHSDAFHFNSWPQRWMCGVWVALEDVNELNGPLHYYPGSHRLPVLDTNDTSALNNNYTNYESAIEELITISGLRKERFLPQKGDCLVWAANLLHGGDPIVDPQRSRLSQVSHYYFEGCSFYTPRTSDMSLGVISYRDEILDIATGEMITSAERPQSRLTTFLGKFRRRFSRI